ncbi:proton extrusion protein PcxA [Synechococcales cyanobacterium C]|uniref:Proton extrusion protein PxcA n=1 Tax=Petrachloros mirabilis ULC683 TaxID=2781853 RepID=A0A8K2A8D9_9CYAN|nr:proton extrusion protein PcxA [Petrachloros mirabilis]NCJ07911.1 proton extrusion protein PcxA [Petrachloros mirabilis ULC683]
MKTSLLNRLKQALSTAERWYLNTPLRALDESYRAAQAIKQLEDEYFEGQHVCPEARYDGAVADYLQSSLNKYLRMARMRLTEFKASSFFIEIEQSQQTPPPPDLPRTARDDRSDYVSEYTLPPGQYSAEAERPDTDPGLVLAKLQFIDQVLSRYQAPEAALRVVSKRPPVANPEDSDLRGVNDSFYEAEFTSDDISADPTKLDSASFIPRSILRTANRFKRELDPNPNLEEEVMRDFRSSRNRTRAAIKFILLLIILPLLTQQVSKNLIISPLVDRWKGSEQIEVRINPEIENTILAELSRFEEQLRFQNLLSSSPLTAPEFEAQVRRRAVELSEEYRWALTDPIKNIFADLLSFAVFCILIFSSKPQIVILKSFLDEILYGLSDSAKAFIIILFTDVFVGFHSPHGWEVIIESILEHFGLPQSRNFINMFIATFPVMLDTVFKYWIFRYLNQVSPSAVATYRNMNE